MDYRWRKCESYQSAPPEKRWGATLTPVNNKLFLIGGYNLVTISFGRSCDGGYKKNVYYYDLRFKTWKTTDCTVNYRSGHVATAIFDNYILIHGGCYIDNDKTEHILGDFICLCVEDEDNIEKIPINRKNEGIGKLCNHSWCIDNQSEKNPIIYIFGGKNENGLNDKFFKLSITKDGNKICIDTHEIKLPDISPDSRMFHSFNFYDDNHIGLIGGCSLDYRTIYNDSWIYNTRTNRWKMEENDDDDDDENYVDKGKAGHTVEKLDKRTFFIFGGMISDYETVNRLEIKYYEKDYGDDDDDDDDEDDKKKKKKKGKKKKKDKHRNNVSNDELNSFILSPGRRRGHSSCHISKVMFIFGGFNGSGFNNDLYMFGKEEDIEDLESTIFNNEMNRFCNRNNRKVLVPDSWRNYHDYNYYDGYDEENKTKSYFYDSRLLSYYPFAYKTARRKGYSNDLSKVTKLLGKMIDDCGDPDNKIDDESFSTYLDTYVAREDEEYYLELQRKIRQKAEEQHEASHQINFPCNICRDKAISHVLIPCGCYCVCERCAEATVGNKCPACNKAVESTTKLYVDNQ